MASQVPNITLNNGLKIPQLGLGTWGVSNIEINYSKLIIIANLNGIETNFNSYENSV